MSSDAARSREAGQAILEFALAIVIFMTMLMALVEGAWYAFSINSLERAAQSGGRHAALVAPPLGNGAASLAEVRAVVNSEAAAWSLSVPSASVSVSVYRTATGSWCSTDACFTNRAIGDKVRVSFDYTHVPLAALVFGAGTSFALPTIQTEYVVE